MKKPAVFLDRDGVLNEEVSYIASADALHIYDYARECVRKLQDAGCLAIVISNQSGIARGYFTEEDLAEIHEKLIGGTGVDAVYYCPHHPEGIVPEYAMICSCRKPETGLIDRACLDHAIDLSRSFLIGDRVSDIQTGRNAGIRTILVRTGYGAEDEKRDIHPDFVCDDLRDATEICLKMMKESACAG